MEALRQSFLVRYLVIPITILAMFSGCYKWSRPSQSPVDFFRDEEPSGVRLWLDDGGQLIVHDATVMIGDPLLVSGLVNDTLRTIRLDEVAYVERRTFNILGTVGIVLLVPIVVFSVAIVVRSQQ